MTIESKSVVAQTTPEKLYAFLCDFNNFSRFIPADKVQGWQASTDRCSFGVGGYIQLTLEYAERTPYSCVVVTPATNSASPVPFKMKILLSPDGNDAVRANIVFDVEGGNPMMNMMLKPKLREAADKMVEMIPYIASGL